MHLRFLVQTVPALSIPQSHRRPNHRPREAHNLSRTTQAHPGLAPGLSQPKAWGRAHQCCGSALLAQLGTHGCPMPSEAELPPAPARLQPSLARDAARHQGLCKFPLLTQLSAFLPQPTVTHRSQSKATRPGRTQLHPAVGMTLQPPARAAMTSPARLRPRMRPSQAETPSQRQGIPVPPTPCPGQKPPRSVQPAPTPWTSPSP